MSNTQLRANVRNLLVGATLQEMWDFRVGKVAQGDTVCVAYTDEYVREVRDEFDESERWAHCTRWLDSIEQSDKSGWSVQQFYAECLNCEDIHLGATIAGPDDITVRAPENDLSRRADRIGDDLFLACADKHGETALAEYAVFG